MLARDACAMKLGVISDTHLEEVAPQLIHIYQDCFSDVDMIIHAGDVVSTAIVDFLGRKPLHLVQGNMDSSEIKKRFPKKKVIDVQGFRLGLIHGWGSPSGIEKRIRSEFDDIDAIVYGHSHMPAYHTERGVIFFNPGSAAGFSISGSHSIGILDISKEIRGSIITL